MSRTYKDTSSQHQKYVTYTQRYNPSTPKICYVHTKIQALNTKNMLRIYTNTNFQPQNCVKYIKKELNLSFCMLAMRHIL
jgi:hypothetical protein